MADQNLKRKAIAWPNFLRVTLILLLFGLSPRLVSGTVMTREQAQDWEKKRVEIEAIENRSDDFDHSNDRSTVEMLRRVKLDGVQFGNVDMQSVVQALTFKSRDANPARVSMKFRIVWPESTRSEDMLGRTIQRNVCIIYKNPTSLFDLLMIISEQTNFSFRVKKGEVIFQQWEPGAYVSLPNMDLSYDKTGVPRANRQASFTAASMLR